MCYLLNTVILGLIAIVTLSLNVAQGNSKAHLIKRRSSELGGTPVKFPDEVKSLSDFLLPASEIKDKDGVAVKFGNVYNYPTNWPSTKPVAIPFHQYRPGGSAVNFFSASSHYQGNGFTGANSFGQSGHGFANNGAAGFGQSSHGFANNGAAGFGQSSQGFANNGAAGFGQSNQGFANNGAAGFGQSSQGFANNGAAGFGQSSHGFNSGASNFGQPNHGSTQNAFGQSGSGLQSGGINSGFQGSIHQTPTSLATAGTFPGNQGFQGSIHSTSGTGATFPGGFQSAIAGSFGYQRPFSSSASIGSNQFSSNGYVFPGWSQQGFHASPNTYGPSNSIFTGNHFQTSQGHEDRPIKFGYYKGY